MCTIAPSLFARKDKVLILHSYHQGLSWSDDITDGLLSVFDQHESVEVFFEYMDTKRRFDSEYISEFVDVFDLKHKSLEYSMVMAVDNNALQFVRLNYHQFFDSLPIVFTGIDQFDDALIDDIPLISGVAEYSDFEKTIELALQFHPKTENFVLISDNLTTSSVVNRNHIVSIWPNIKNRPNLKFIENVTIDELVDSVRNLSSTDIIFLSNFSRDREGNFISYMEVMEIIRSNTDLPIYSVWDFYLDKGIVGGMLTSGFKQGEYAADIAMEVLNGEDIRDIPMKTDGYNFLQFDFKQMKKYGLNTEQLPKGSKVVNLPLSFLASHKVLVIISASFVLFLILLMVYLRWKRLITERKLIKENIQLEAARNRLRRMLDANSDGYWEHNFKTQNTIISKNIWELLGYDSAYIKENLDFFEKIIHPKDFKAFINEQNKVFKGDLHLLDITLRVYSASNEMFWFRVKAKAYDLDEEIGEPLNMVGTLNDITVSKLAELQIKDDELKLRASEQRWRSLFEQAADEIFVYDFDGHIMDANLAACRLLQYSPDELIGKNIIEINDQHDLESLRRIWGGLNEKTPSIKFDSIRRRKDGSTYPIDVHLSLIDFGDTRCILSVASDISARYETERQILNAVIETEERERKRFATDLHDSIGPLLSSINLYLSALEKRSSEKKDIEIITASRDIVRETLLNVKEISNNLSPHILNDFGLVKAIESFIKKINLSETINISFDNNVTDRATNFQTEVVIYRVFTELITNTLKHAQATNIQVSLKQQNHILNMIYIDDGIGFNHDEVFKQNKGMGLYNILSRVKSVQGSYQIKSNPEIGGMMVVLNVKL